MASFERGRGGGSWYQLHIPGFIEIKSKRFGKGENKVLKLGIFDFCLSSLLF